MDLSTIVDRTSVTAASVLVDRMRRHEPERTVHVLALDGLRWPTTEGVRVWSVDELRLPGPSWLATAATHPDHRNDVLAGPLVAAILASGVPSVAYIDPSAALLGPLAELERALADHPLVLVGQASPDGDEHDETLGAVSVVNSRILAARAGEAVDAILADWPRWAEPETNGPETFARNAVQRYLDRVAAWSTDAAVLDHPGYGLNGLRLPGREIAAGPDGTVTVDGAPLRHLDLVGFDVNTPYLLPGRDDDGPRIPEIPALKELLRRYVDDHSAVDVDVVRREPDGSPPLNVLRREMARQAYEDGVLDGLDPTSTAGSAAFEEWLNAPAKRGSAAGLTRQHEAIWTARGDLRNAYPHLDGPDASGFAGWLRAYGVAQCGLRPTELPEADEPEVTTEAPTSDDLAWGVNVAGFFRSELGLGEAARLLVSGLDAAAIPALPVQGQLVPPCRQEAEFTFGAPDASPYPINIVCMNGDTIDPFRREVPGFFEGRHTIALWWWELVDAFPADWRPAFDDIDEVWVATQHIYDAIAPHSPVPVIKIPMPVTVPRLRPFTRTALGLPEDGFVFLFVYDYHSTSARKNPLGLIRAFREAFPAGSGAKLVLKCINAKNMPDHHDAVLYEIGDDPDITVIDRYVTADQKNALIGACDCYVSLHRSEGFGLTPAEAMLLGKPVIATRYGGTLDFMTDENSYLVDYRWTTVGTGAHPYPPEARWAEPDLSHAAALMREVFEDQPAARARGARAQRDMEQHHSPAVAGAAMRIRLREIYDSMQAEGRSSLRVSALPVPDHGELAARIASGPPAVNGGRGLKSPLQKSVGRVLGPWARHYRRIHDDLLDGLHDVESTLSAASAELDGRRREEVAQTLAALRRVRADLGDYDRHLGEHDQRLDALEARLTALEPDVEQHLAEHRALPFVAEDRAFESWSDERLGAVEGFRSPAPAAAGDGYRTFEDAFRGDAERVRELQAAYVGLLDGCGPVVDCGCGRGELLGLLGDAGTEARGVDSDPGMLAVARAAGLDVVEADAVAYLEALEPGVLGGVTALEVIEHLPEPALRRFFAAAFRALRPGGTLIVETVNPHVVHALKAFWLDPTHHHPLFPEVVLELCREAGFGEGAVFHPTGSGDVAVDRYREPAYAVLARRASAAT